MFRVMKEIKDFISDKFKDTKNITTDSVDELKNKVNQLEKMIIKKIKK